MTPEKGVALDDLSIQVKMWFGYPWKHMNSSQDNSSGHVWDPRCEEVLVLEEMGRKDKIQQEFKPHMALMSRPGPLPHVGAVLQAQLFLAVFLVFHYRIICSPESI